MMLLLSSGLQQGIKSPKSRQTSQLSPAAPTGRSPLTNCLVSSANLTDK